MESSAWTLLSDFLLFITTEAPKTLENVNNITISDGLSRTRQKYLIFKDIKQEGDLYLGSFFDIS